MSARATLRSGAGWLRGAFLLLAAAWLAGCASAGPTRPVQSDPALVDDVAGARQMLEQERTAIRLASGESTARRVRRLTELGLFQDADSLLSGAAARTLDLALAEAALRLRQYRFSDARALVDAALRQQPRNRVARLLAIRLAIEAWQLDWAEEQARGMLGRGRRDAEAALLLGRIHLLEREYDAALEWAGRVRGWVPGEADALVLEADVHFWEERAAEAEAALRSALAIDPLNADARFAYGYALWRRGAPALLTPMAAQWRLALELDPLHQRTHWHLGNGHTPLTYSDYASVADTVVRQALAPVDSLISQGRLGEAVAESRRVEAEFPASVLPALYRGSAWYLLGDRSSAAPLDSAQREFRTILSVAPAFGPAHNGIAAVLKERQFRGLARYDSLEAAIGFTSIPAGALDSVFPDLRYYPGERVARMVTQQLGPAIAYLPLLERQGRRFLIPPLHRDLAAATGDASFRTAATFDNRRWMDIRGVGGSEIAAAGIEYVERGSHQERGVLLHEFVHLVHYGILTETQRRRVRELYDAALQEDRMLDYYAASNEQEFLGQAVEAYQSSAKVHPLNHKSMNTRDELRRKDPATFAFVAELMTGLEQALAGDRNVLRSNWAEVYVGLARRELAGAGDGRPNPQRAAALLDSALVWDGAYLPALVEYAAVEGARGRPARAEEWLRTAETIDSDYAPIPATRSDLLGLADDAMPGAAETRIRLLRRAVELEDDPVLSAGYERDIWELQEAMGRVPEAIASAEEYAARGSTVSSRLRELREDALDAAMRMRREAGYAEEAIPYFRGRLAAKPLDLDLRVQYGRALMAAGQWSEAEETLQESWTQLVAAGGLDARLSLTLAELKLSVGDSAAARRILEPLLDRSGDGAPPDDGRLARILVSLGESTEAQRQLASMAAPREAAERAELAFTRGWISAWRGDAELAERLYREAVAADPYHLEARLALYWLLREQGRVGEARLVAESAATLPLPLGPSFREALER